MEITQGQQNKFVIKRLWLLGHMFIRFDPYHYLTKINNCGVKNTRFYNKLSEISSDLILELKTRYEK